VKLALQCAGFLTRVCRVPPAPLFRKAGMDYRAIALLSLVALLGKPADAQQGGHKFTVINDADVAIEYFYAAPCGGDGWGKDRLAAREIIKPGARKQFSFKSRDSDCCYDLRVTLYTGASRQKLNADICREPDWTIR
jgi:hypothetical protein